MTSTRSAARLLVGCLLMMGFTAPTSASLSTSNPLSMIYGAHAGDSVDITLNLIHRVDGPGMFLDPFQWERDELPLTDSGVATPPPASLVPPGYPYWRYESSTAAEDINAFIPLLPGTDPGPGDVPEPTSAVMLVLGSLAVMRRRG